MERLNLLLTDGPSLVLCNFAKKEVAKKPKKAAQVRCDYSFGISFDTEKEEIETELSVKSESENIPFEFHLVSRAKFKARNLPSAIKDNSEIEKRAAVEALPYIFPFLKEMVADLTRKTYVPPFYLPSIDLNNDKFEKNDD